MAMRLENVQYLLDVFQIVNSTTVFPCLSEGHSTLCMTVNKEGKTIVNMLFTMTTFKALFCDIAGTVVFLRRSFRWRECFAYRATHQLLHLYSS